MSSYITSVTKQLAYYKRLGEKAIEQLPTEALFWKYNEESNNIAIIINHIVGNMLSRFTDFLTTDGEKPWRDRDREFEEIPTNRDALLRSWNEGWDCVLNTIRDLGDDQMENIVYIRNEGHTVMEAINRQLAHYPYHIGQIVFISKMFLNDKWESLSIPRDKSNAYNAKKFEQEKVRRHYTDDL